MKIRERKLKQPDITHQPDPRVPDKMSRCEPAPSKIIHQHVPAPSTKVNPKETSPEVQPIVRRTRYHTQNTQPTITLRTRDQLQQALKITDSQAAQQYFPKVLLDIWSTTVIDLAMQVINYGIGENLEYRQL